MSSKTGIYFLVISLLIDISLNMCNIGRAVDSKGT